MLAESFNATAARLEQLVGAQRGFVADASHQLRTPLAAMRLRLENLEADVHGAAAEDLEGALDEVARLSRLVDGLLALARAEQSASSPAPIAVDAGHRRSLRRVGRVRGREARAHRSPTWTGSPVARATPGRLEQVVDNLLNNALEVAPEGSAVRRRRRERGEWVELRVSDEGPGMIGRGARARVRPLLAVGRRPQGRAPERSLRPRARRSCASSWSVTAATSRSSRRRAAAWRWWCGCAAAMRPRRRRADERERQLSTASAT